MMSPKEMLITRKTSSKLLGRGRSITDKTMTIPIPINASLSERALRRWNMEGREPVWEAIFYDYPLFCFC